MSRKETLEIIPEVDNSSEDEAPKAANNTPLRAASGQPAIVPILPSPPVDGITGARSRANSVEIEYIAAFMTTHSKRGYGGSGRTSLEKVDSARTSSSDVGDSKFFASFVSIWRCSVNFAASDKPSLSQVLHFLLLSSCSQSSKILQPNGQFRASRLYS